MKIAIIGHKRIPSNEGGIEKGVEQHAVRMVQRGNDVTIYNSGCHNVFRKEFDGKKLKEYKDINIVTVPTVKGAACFSIYSFLATIHAAFSRYDCVSFRASGSCAMIPLAKLFGLRVVASLHGECEIIRGCHNRDKGTAENERLRNPKFIFSYPKNERLIFLGGSNAIQKEISTMRVG